MKNRQKLILLLGLLIGFGVFSFLDTAKAAALDGNDLKSGTYTFLAKNTIEAKIAGKTVQFQDGKTSDDHYSYAPGAGSPYCQPDGVKDNDYGIKFDSDPEKAGAKATGVITLGFAANLKDCQKVGPQTISVNTNGVAGAEYQWKNANIVSLDGNDTYIPISVPGNFNGRTYGLGTEVCGSKDDGSAVYKEYGQIILLGQPGGHSGKLYSLTGSNRSNGNSTGKDALDKWPELKGLFPRGTCWEKIDPVNGGALKALAIQISGTQGKDATIGEVQTVSPQGQSCELDSGGFSLAWLMCPLLAAGNDFVNGPNGNGGLIGLFESQLSFKVDRDLNSNGSNDVQTAWSLIKNIASAALVIIMLVMIFSQAISAGPFDAYTVRKLLPRLIAAVILMQLSWYILSWVIDIFDDLANSLVDLLYAPFGGSDAMNLGHLLAHAHIGTGDAIAINFVALVGAIALGLAALPALLLMVLAVVSAMVTALVVLIMRKIIIIFCLILAPLALVAWILPGTQRYWKLWYDNLLKVLFMFPLVVGLVAAGHIFAYIVGTQGNGTFLSLIFILVGVFGPLFLLPKTFKWGGQAMSLASGAISGATNRFLGRESSLGKGVQGYGERKQGEKAKKYDPNARLGSKVFRRIQSGHMIPTKRSQRLAIAAGDKWSQERDEEAQALIKRKGEKVLREGYETIERDEDGNLLAAKMEGEQFVNYKHDDLGNLLTADNEITDDKEKAAKVLSDSFDADFTVREKTNDANKALKKKLKGVQAMKQMWVDLAEDGRDDHEKKMAIRQLTATASWPEVQGSFTKSGKRVIDVASWGRDIATSPEDYPRVLSKRVDAAPHIVDVAEKALIAEQERRSKDPELTLLDERQQADFKSAIRMDYAIQKQMSNEDFATQSDGFWQEAARVATYSGPDETLKARADMVRQHLIARFESIKQAGPTAQQQMLGHLVGGGVQTEVDKILRSGGEDRSITDYMPSSRASARPQANTGGGIDIDHDDYSHMGGA
jgi:hypothetical protein